uniref:Gustatory receptor n=1 Tax=Culicoides sonorensis TaxID=179676 RepID=A0A336LH03_CULSO
MGAGKITYIFILKFFKFLGLVPNVVQSRMPLSRVYSATIITGLFVYWAVLLLSFWIPHGKVSNKISVISNWIQLLVNAITLSITLSYPIISAALVCRINDLFQHFDKKVEELGVDINFQKMSRTIVIIIGLLVAYNSYMLCYDLYVTYFLTSVSNLWYWALTFMPLFLYSFAMCGALCVLLLLHFRFKTLNQLLSREIKGNRSPFKVGQIVDILMVNEKDKPMRYQHKLTNIFYLMHDLYDLSKLIGHYYGPVFLTVFTAVFIVTTIQIYYIYTIFYAFDTRNENTIWSIILCANIIILNIIMVFSLTSVCESISNESKLSIDTISKLKINGTNTCNPEEVQKIVTAFHCTNSHVTFSANGFFNINYSMLCSMIGGITTYLIIYIQFYALYGSKDGSDVDNVVKSASSNHDKDDISESGVPEVTRHMSASRSRMM